MIVTETLVIIPFNVSVPQKQPAEGGIYAVRLILMLKKKDF